MTPLMGQAITPTNADMFKFIPGNSIDNMSMLVRAMAQMTNRRGFKPLHGQVTSRFTFTYIFASPRLNESNLYGNRAWISAQ